ncbi:hypothetical protein [Sphingobacterium sp. FBM7-1]|uniref:hypothetical protein n=1 Tax=Sphingobacterium sp. FBM7-1 TaxID=2886688 RepID=UPI001D0FAD49|nr:hypothetical protein [Sphingobacterium sp. FBM7-1]MCC2599784.1 hypothetical protein [Sphingobacterium sp. FBM7-1]
MKKAILAVISIILLGNTLLGQDYKVIQEKVKIYAGPDFQKEIGYLTKGYEIKNLRKYDNDWSYIEEGRIKGYISSHGVEEINAKYNEKRSYAGIIALIISLIVLGLLLKAIYGKEKKTELQQQTENPLPQNTTFIYRSKSVGGAIILAALFGPLGMFYSTINGALIMIILPVLLIMGIVSSHDSDNAALKVLLTSGTLVFFIFYWFICIMWAAIAASNSKKVAKIE